MEAATHQPLNAPAPVDTGPPKLTIEKFADAGIACLKFVGTIDESFEGKRLGDTAAGDVLDELINGVDHHLGRGGRCGDESAVDLP